MIFIPKDKYFTLPILHTVCEEYCYDVTLPPGRGRCGMLLCQVQCREVRRWCIDLGFCNAEPFSRDDSNISLVLLICELYNFVQFAGLKYMKPCKTKE